MPISLLKVFLLVYCVIRLGMFILFKLFDKVDDSLILFLHGITLKHKKFSSGTIG